MTYKDNQCTGCGYASPHHRPDCSLAPVGVTGEYFAPSPSAETVEVPTGYNPSAIMVEATIAAAVAAADSRDKIVTGTGPIKVRGEMAERERFVVAGDNLYRVSYRMPGTDTLFARLVVARDPNEATGALHGWTSCELVEEDISLSVPVESQP